MPHIGMASSNLSCFTQEPDQAVEGKVPPYIHPGLAEDSSQPVDQRRDDCCLSLTPSGPLKQIVAGVNVRLHAFK